MVEEAVREFQALAGQRRKADRLVRAKQQSELAEVKRCAAPRRSVADGTLSGAAEKERLDALEARRTVLEEELKAKPADAGLVLLPRSFGAAEGVLAMENTVERRAALGALRTLIRKVVVIPLPERGRTEVTMVT